MKRCGWAFAGLLTLVLSFPLNSCSLKSDPDYVKDIPDPYVLTDACWISYASFEETVSLGDAAFIGTLLGYEQVEKTSTVRTYFRVDEVVFGDISDREVALNMTMGVGGFFKGIRAHAGGYHPGYQAGDQYLMVVGNQPEHLSLFNKGSKYEHIQSTYLDLTNQVYRTVWEALDYSNKKEVCSAVREILSRKEKQPRDSGNGTWESADFVAEVRLNEVIREATPYFTGTSYRAEVIRMIRGEEQDLVKLDGKQIMVTLEASKTEKGGSYVIGFSLKDGATTVYLQEGEETVCSPEQFKGFLP